MKAIEGEKANDILDFSIILLEPIKKLKEELLENLSFLKSNYNFEVSEIKRTVNNIYYRIIKIHVFSYFVDITKKSDPIEKVQEFKRKKEYEKYKEYLHNMNLIANKAKQEKSKKAPHNKIKRILEKLNSIYFDAENYYNSKEEVDEYDEKHRKLLLDIAGIWGFHKSLDINKFLSEEIVREDKKKQINKSERNISMPIIFISYCREDKDELKFLIKHLRALERDGNLRYGLIRKISQEVVCGNKKL